MNKLCPKLQDVLVLIILSAVIVVGRLMPHAPNFTPAGAVALFSGFLFARYSLAILAVLLGMGISDVLIGMYDPRIMATVYCSLLLPIALRTVLRAKLGPFRIALTALCGSAIFFISTNFAVWLFSDMYPKTLSGLGNCYLAGIPFLRFTALGDLFWSGLLFGVYFLLRRWVVLMRPSAESMVPARI